MTEIPHDARRRPWPLILLALLFIGPLAAAAFVYYVTPDWRPGARVNHGELIEPPQPMPDVGLAGPGGEPLAEAPLRHRWTLIYVEDGECDAACQEVLFETWQVRYLLHRDLDRVRRILVYTGAAPDAAIADGHPDLLVADGRAAGGPALLAALPSAAGTGDAVYLVDPLGNLMMRFPVTGTWQDMHKDLKKLLKLSRIG